jgi:hypothetical protein
MGLHVLHPPIPVGKPIPAPMIALAIAALQPLRMQVVPYLRPALPPAPVGAPALALVALTTDLNRAPALTLIVPPTPIMAAAPLRSVRQCAPSRTTGPDAAPPSAGLPAGM